MLFLLLVYIDKPFAESLRTAKEIFDIAEKYKTPLMSSSALRYSVLEPFLFSVTGGGLIAAILYLLFRDSPEYRSGIVSNLRNATLWKYIGGLQFFNLIFAYTLFYPGMNAMADHGLGGMCYPMMVGSCIAAFTLLSILVLKERFRLVQAVGLGLCVLGLAMLCFPA